MSLGNSSLKKTANNIGTKIRYLRSNKGLTQREISEGVVSRNMLSMIESGNALPSIETLLRISESLSIPAGFFFAEGDEEKLYIKQETITQVYKLYNNKNYSEAAALCKPFLDFDGEMRLCYSICHLRIACELIDKYMLTSAYDHLQKASSVSSETFFGGDSIHNVCNFILKLIDNAGFDYIPDELIDRIDPTGTTVPTSFLVYLTAYRYAKNGDHECASSILRLGIISGFYALHIRGLVLMSQSDFDGATRLFDLALSSDDGGFFSKYKLLCDLEFCRKSAGDFESAYSLSTSRMEMLGMFSK